MAADVPTRLHLAAVRPGAHQACWNRTLSSARQDMPVAIHVQSAGAATTMTPVGFFARYAELHAMHYPIMYIPHLTSLIFEGVYDRFENFRTVFVEGGTFWLYPLLCRMDYFW